MAKVMAEAQQRRQNDLRDIGCIAACWVWKTCRVSANEEWSRHWGSKAFTLKLEWGTWDEGHGVQEVVIRTKRATWVWPQRSEQLRGGGQGGRAGPAGRREERARKSEHRQSGSTAQRERARG